MTSDRDLEELAEDTFDLLGEMDYEDRMDYLLDAYEDSLS